jgi:hypothetical protein
MDTLIIVDPADSERGVAAQLAADLMEALYTEDPSKSVARFFVLADPRDCLEIGLSTLGRATARTVEGGERAVSALVLVPIRGERESPNAGDMSIMSEGKFGDDAGTLRDLVTFGAIEEDEQWRIREEPFALHTVLGALIARKTIGQIVVMAGSDNLWSSLRESASARDIERLDCRPRALAMRIEERRDAPVDRYRRDLWQRVPKEYDDEIVRAEVTAQVRTAILLASLIDRLISDDLSHRR